MLRPRGNPSPLRHRSASVIYPPSLKTGPPANSGIVEGLNYKIKLTIRKAYGYRVLKVAEIAIYHALGKLPEPELTHKFC